jgi:hypothetical protein
LENY